MDVRGENLRKSGKIIRALSIYFDRGEEQDIDGR
jgi:hypothetical protein